MSQSTPQTETIPLTDFMGYRLAGVNSRLLLSEIRLGYFDWGSWLSKSRLGRCCLAS